MENIKMKIESKFWNENGMWCVAVTLPEMEFWSESCWDKSREKAEKKVMDLVKKHITWIREMKRSAEVQERILVY